MSKVTISLKQSEVEEAIANYVKERIKANYSFDLEDFEVNILVVGQERRIECEVTTEIKPQEIRKEKNNV